MIPGTFADDVLHAVLSGIAMVFFLLWAWPHVRALQAKHGGGVIRERNGLRLIANHVERSTRGGRHG